MDRVGRGDYLRIIIDEPAVKKHRFEPLSGDSPTLTPVPPNSPVPRSSVRCPWCPDGFLLMSTSRYADICSRGTGCASANPQSVVDSSFAVSGISIGDLRTRLISAFHEHCMTSGCESSRAIGSVTIEPLLHSEERCALGRVFPPRGGCDDIELAHVHEPQVFFFLSCSLCGLRELVA
jgi:hypothetical protein